MKEQKGFTLIELIIVIAVIAILAGAIFVAIDPARRLHEARNTRRLSDIATILDAVRKYQIDNDGTHYSAVVSLTDGNFYLIGTDTRNSCEVDCFSETTEEDCVDLASMGSNYLAAVPQDPKTGTQAQTGYMLMKATNGSITIYACESEGEGAGGAGTPPDLSITR